jgi:hypothetical protein
MFSMRSKTIWVERILGEFKGDISAEEIISKTQFSIPAGHSITSVRDWFKRHILRQRSNDHRAALTAIMNAIHDVQVFGTETGIEAIGVPFPHIIFLVGSASAEFRMATEERVAELLRKDWNDLIDPLIDLRVRMLLGEDVGQHEIVGYFGRGVFTPRHNERPIGRIEISAVGSSSVDEPMLPGEIPAGLYRGQASLVFASAERFTPAVSSLLPNNCRFLLRGSSTFDSVQSPLFLECEVTNRDPSVFRPMIAPICPPPAPYDASFTVETDDGRVLQVNVIEDKRPSRLFADPPDSSVVFAIVGIVQPRDRPDMTVRRWWIDLDSNQKLIGSALRPRCWSIICEGDEIEQYDWKSSARTKPTQMRLVQTQSTAGAITLLRTNAGELGYLLPPPVAMTASFEDTSTISGRNIAHERFELDWLDFSGAVETSSLYAERLAVHASKQAAGPIRIPGLDGRPLPNPGFLAKRASSTTFDETWKGDWEHGSELIVGPLVLRIVVQE